MFKDTITQLSTGFEFVNRSLMYKVTAEKTTRVSTYIQLQLKYNQNLGEFLVLFNYVKAGQVKKNKYLTKRRGCEDVRLFILLVNLIAYKLLS